MLRKGVWVFFLSHISAARAFQTNAFLSTSLLSSRLGGLLFQQSSNRRSISYFSRRAKPLVFSGLSQSQSMGAPTTTTPTTDDVLPNWRVLSLPEDGGTKGIVESLQVHPEWSEGQYQEALALYDKFMACEDTYCSPGVRDALNTLDHAYRLYGPHSVICSFNGGKDAVVIFQLMRAAHANYYRTLMQEKTESMKIVRPRALYFEHKDEFPEVLDYLQKHVALYDIDMIAFAKGIKFNQGLEVLVHNNIPPDSAVAFPMAFVLGTRVGDPNAADQGYFSPSSHYMPPFMRVNPILEWTYGQVWHFLRVFSLPYCELYDQGYTSLGTTKDTFRCPALAVPGTAVTEEGGIPKYWPAYMLQDWSQERAGREASSAKPKSKKKKRSSMDSETASVVGSVITTASVMRTTDTKELQPQTMQHLLDDGVDLLGADEEEGAEEEYVEDVNEELHDDSRSVVSYSENHSLTQRTAGLLVIGDEILKGSTPDLNTQNAAKAFRENNVLLKRVVVVSDDQDDIVNEILTMQHEVDVIVTSGGVGPTHDDVTITSVADALGRDMEFHEEMAQLLREKMHTDELTEGQRKMATLPSRSKLRFFKDDEWPVLQCRNVFILPGVPEFFLPKIEGVANYVSSDAIEQSAVYKVILSVDEGTIVNVLNNAVEGNPDVTFGSYPFVSHPEFKTVLTLEGKMKKAEASGDDSAAGASEGEMTFTKDEMDANVGLALDYLVTNLPAGSILRVENDDGLE